MATASLVAALRERVTIQRATTAADGYGGQSVTWANLYTQVPAAVHSIRGREAEVQGREVTIRTALFKIRYGHDITTLDRIVWDGDNWDVTSVEDREGTSKLLTIVGEVGLGT